MRLEKEYQLKDREHKRKVQMLTSLNASTNRLHDTKPSNAIFYLSPTQSLAHVTFDPFSHHLHHAVSGLTFLGFLLLYERREQEKTRYVKL